MIQGAKESFIAGMSCSMNQAAGSRRSIVPERSSERYVELGFHDDEKHVADKEHTTEEGAEPVVRGSNQEKKALDYYGDWASVINAELTEPTTLKDALSSPDKAKWMSAMEKEIESLRKNDVWELVDLPKG